MENTKYTVPAVDIYEAENKYVLVFDMPGANKDAIDIQVADNVLSLTAETEQLTEDWKPIVTEFKFYTYKRNINLGNQVDVENIDATYENGILTVELAKSEKAKPKKIDVKVA